MQRDLERPEFIQKSEIGPAHEKTFTFECKFRWHTEMRTANSKKAAKTLAAQAVVDKLEENLLPEEPTYQAKLEAKMKKEKIKKEKEEIKKEMAKKEIRNSSLYKLSRSNRDLIESSNPATENIKYIKRQISNFNSVKEQFGDDAILQDDENLNLRQKPQSPARSSQSSGSLRSRRRASSPSSPSSKRSRSPVKRVKKSRYSRTRTFSSSSSSSSSSDPPPRRRRPPPIRRRSRSRTPPINSRRRPRSRSPRKRSYSRSSRKKSRSRSPILPPKSKRSLSRSSSIRSHSRSPSIRFHSRSPSRRSRARSPSSPPPRSRFTLPPPGHRDHVTFPEPPPPIRPPAVATVPGTSRPRFLIDIPTYSPSPLIPAGPGNIVGASGRPRSLMNIPTTYAPFINDSGNPFSIPPPNLNSSSQKLVLNRLEEEIVEAEKKRQISQSAVASRKDPRLNQKASLPMKKFIAVRKDLFNESLPDPQTPEVPPVPLALMVPPPQNLGNFRIEEADETQINPNDYKFEIDTTHIKLEIKTEVKVEKEYV